MKLETDNILAARKALKSSIANEARSSSIGVFGIAGRKTGIVLNKPIFQDDDELDNIDSYWNAAITSPEIKPTVASLEKKAGLKEPAHVPPLDTLKKSSPMTNMTAITPKQDDRRRSSVKGILKPKKSLGHLEQEKIATDSHDDENENENNPGQEKENQPIQHEGSFAFTRKSLGSDTKSPQAVTTMLSEDDEISFKDNSNIEPLADTDGGHMHEEELGVQESNYHGGDAETYEAPEQVETLHESYDDPHHQHTTSPVPLTAESQDEPISASAPAPVSKRASTKRKGKSFDQHLTELVVESESEAGVRDNRRRRFRPLEFWKNERVVYGRRESSARLHLPAVLDVITVPPEEPSVESSRRRRETLAGSTLKKRGYKEKEMVIGSVYDMDQDQEVSKMIMISPDQFKPKAVPNHNFKLHTTFSEGGYVTAGVLSFPKEAIKPNKNSGKHTLFFTVLSGVFKVTVHQLTFIATTGCQFIVPRGNQYEIRNMANKESRLSYCHCKDLLAETAQVTRSEPEPESESEPELESETQTSSSVHTSLDSSTSFSSNSNSNSNSNYSSSSKFSDTDASSKAHNRTAISNRPSRRK